MASLTSLSGCLLVGYDVEPHDASADSAPEDAGPERPLTEIEAGEMPSSDAAAADGDANGEQSQSDASQADGRTADADSGQDLDADEDAGPSDGTDSGQSRDANDDAQAGDDVDAAVGCTQAPNACGGCAVLANAPGDACGVCGLGRYVCDGSDALACSGGDALPASGGGAVPIDDFEDGDGFILSGSGLSGLWDTVSDPTPGGVIVPALHTGLVPANQGANGTARSGHVFGSGFTEWGAGLAASLSAYACSYDARAQSGVSFYIKGTGTGSVAVMVATRQTVPIEKNGTCAENCYDHFAARVPLTPAWRFRTVPWTALAQAGWGPPASFLSSELMSIQFTFDPGIAFDVYVDEVSFY